ncbi:MAG TPA: helix-turn-helix domain-containing protein [Acidimicrobiales bacterium]|nr:helix-turn-helix domain-containing protein [Acidimicrobiales bacterium]
MSIGEFARKSGLSPKALRLYDDLGLLPPAYVDASSNYRFYDATQLDQARLVAALRQLRVPLADIKDLLALEPEEGAQRISDYWAVTETEHSARRDLANYLVDRLRGKKPIMYEVRTRDIPERSLLCLKRNVNGWDGAWAFGKEFIGLLKEHPLPRMEGRAGATFCIYWGEVSDDSDGPMEWCRPVPDSEAGSLAAGLPQLTLRTEPAHREAYVNLGASGPLSQAEWPLVSGSLHEWAGEHQVRPSVLGVRITYLATGPVTPESVPDCDFAVPFLG